MHLNFDSQIDYSSEMITNFRAIKPFGNQFTFIENELIIVVWCSVLPFFPIKVSDCAEWSTGEKVVGALFSLYFAVDIFAFNVRLLWAFISFHFVFVALSNNQFGC